jgi:hypothetical protein
MDETTKKFFENLVKSNEQRTANLIKTEIASVKCDLSRKVNTLEAEVANLKSELSRANTEFQKKNVLVEGITEKKLETWIETERQIKDLFKKLGIPESTEFDECFRIGKTTEGKVRPILLKLIKLKDKRPIMSSSTKLKGTNIYVNDDLTKQQRITNAILSKKQKQLRGLHPDASVRIRNGRLLFTDGSIFRKYDVAANNTIQEIPSNSVPATLQSTSSQDMEEI